MFSRFARFCAVVLICGCACAQEAPAPLNPATSGPTPTDAVPHLIKFSGTIRDASGNPMTGVSGITFALYADQNGGGALWLETQNVQADGEGRYTVSLGATQPLGVPAEIFTSGEARWLGVQPDGQAELPRALLLSVPYALKAGDATTIGGLPASAFVRANPTSISQNASFPETDPGLLPQAGLAATTKNKTVTTAGGTSGFLPLWVGTTVLGNSALSQSGSELTLSGNLFLKGGNLNVAEGQVLGQTGFFQSNNGSQALSGIQSGSSGNGVEGVSEANDGVGVFGSGVTGVSGFGLSNGVGVSGQGKFGVSGQGTLVGVLGEISSTDDFASGVKGSATGNGETYAVSGFSSSTTDFAVGVAGFAGASGIVDGVSGFTGSANGSGVYGEGVDESSTGSSFLGCCAFGVWGDTGSTVGTSAGLMGTADDARAMFLQNNSPSGVPTAFMQQSAAGKFALVAGGGQQNNSCTIDTSGALFCPGGTSAVASVDSGQRQVALYGVQSPQQWFEDFGSAQLAGGAAIVHLDLTFAQTVNTSLDYHVFLTPKGDCRGLYVSQTTPTEFEVRELGGGLSSVAFDYRIVALRRGFESVRTEDLTKRMAEATVLTPKRAASSRIPLPRQALPDQVPSRSGVPFRSNLLPTRNTAAAYQ
jgi:hypothetical protein